MMFLKVDSILLLSDSQKLNIIIEKKSKNVQLKNYARYNPYPILTHGSTEVCRQQNQRHTLKPPFVLLAVPTVFIWVSPCTIIVYRVVSSLLPSFYNAYNGINTNCYNLMK